MRENVSIDIIFVKQPGECSTQARYWQGWLSPPSRGRPGCVVMEQSRTLSKLSNCVSNSPTELAQAMGWPPVGEAQGHQQRGQGSALSPHFAAHQQVWVSPMAWTSHIKWKYQGYLLINSVFVMLKWGNLYGSTSWTLKGYLHALYLGILCG